MIITPIWVAAIVYACELTLLSIGFTLTYMTAKIPNFAHGTYAGIGIYVVFTLSHIFGYSPYIGFPISFLLGGVISILIYIFVIKIINSIGGGDVVLMISTLAIQIFLTSLLNIYAYYLREVYKSYATSFMLKEFDFEIFGYPGIFPVALIICIGSVVLLHYMLTRTKIGLSMRATAENPDLSSVLGVNINNVQIFSWFLTGGLAALAGSMIPMWFQSSPTTGSLMLTSIMAGSLLGGLDNIYGAIVGGFSLGISEIMITVWLQRILGTWVGAYRPMIPMIILIIVLLIEPRGFSGVYDRLKISLANRNKG